jgi:hypothetical protein
LRIRFGFKIHSCSGLKISEENEKLMTTIYSAPLFLFSLYSCMMAIKRNTNEYEIFKMTEDIIMYYMENLLKHMYIHTYRQHSKNHLLIFRRSENMYICQKLHIISIQDQITFPYRVSQKSLCTYHRQQAHSESPCTLIQIHFSYLPKLQQMLEMAPKCL